MPTMELLLSKMIDRINNSVKITGQQELTPAQKQNVRNTIGAASSDIVTELSEFIETEVKNTTESLTNDIDDLALSMIRHQASTELIPSLRWNGEINDRAIYYIGSDIRMVHISNECIISAEKDNIVFEIQGYEYPGESQMINATSVDTFSEEGLTATRWTSNINDTSYTLMMVVTETPLGGPPIGTYLGIIHNWDPINNYFEESPYLHPVINDLYVATVFSRYLDLPALSTSIESISYPSRPITVRKNVITILEEYQPYDWDGSYSNVYTNFNRAIQALNQIEWITYILHDNTTIVEDKSQLGTNNLITAIPGDKDSLPGLYVHDDVKMIIVSHDIESILFPQVDTNYYNDIEKYMVNNREAMLVQTINVTYPDNNASAMEWDEATSITVPYLELESNHEYSCEIDQYSYNGMAKYIEEQNIVYFGNRYLVDCYINSQTDQNYTNDFPFAIMYVPGDNEALLLWSRSISGGRHKIAVYSGTKQLQASHIPMKQLIDENIDYIYEKIAARLPAGGTPNVLPSAEEAKF